MSSPSEIQPDVSSPREGTSVLETNEDLINDECDSQINVESENSEDIRLEEEEIQYDYLDEMVGAEEEVGEGVEIEGQENDGIDEDPIEVWNAGGIDVHQYEILQEQILELGNQIWNLQQACKDYECNLRIAKRSLFRRVQDRMRFWKIKAKDRWERVKTWIKKSYGLSVEETFGYYESPRYRPMLETRYYPQNFQLE